MPSSRKIYQMGTWTWTLSMVPKKTALPQVHEGSTWTSQLSWENCPSRSDRCLELCTLLFENSFIRPNLFTLYNLYRPLPLNLSRSGLGDKVEDPNLPLWVLEVMLADQSPLGLKYCFWVRKEIHWRNGKMMNRKIPMSPYFQKSSDRGNNSKWYIQASR